jgi:hypothetical protein
LTSRSQIAALLVGLRFGRKLIVRISPEQARFVTMVFDESDTWELMDQDRAALQWAMDRIESLQDELNILRKLSPQAALPPRQKSSPRPKRRQSLMAYPS